MRTTALATVADAPEIPLGDDVANRATVEEMVATYQKAVDEIRMGHALIENARLRLGAMFEHDGSRMGFVCHHAHGDIPSPDDMDEQIRRRVWQSLVERLSIRRLMSVKAWTDFSKKMEHETPPAITVENVTGMAAHFRQTAPDMLQAAIHEVFSFLRPPSSGYKTNTEFEIGAKVILEYMVERSFQHWTTNSYRRQNLTALENVFLLCDGKPQTHGAYWSELQSAIEKIPNGQKCEGSTTYFNFKGHKKGTLHLEFKRMDLVAKLNAIAGGARLKPAAPEESP